MRLSFLFALFALACSSKDERARQAADFRMARDSLLSAEVVKSLQSPPSVGRLIYERPADLSYDSLRVKRPELLSTPDRPAR